LPLTAAAWGISGFLTKVSKIETKGFYEYIVVKTIRATGLFCHPTRGLNDLLAVDGAGKPR
jgi:hypothetical protein